MSKKNVVYLYTNKINGHKYVGKAIDFGRRMKEHERGTNIKNGSFLERAIQKYGIESFEIEILESVPHLKGQIRDNHLAKLERFYIKQHNTFKDKNHYNLTEGGEGSSGRKHSAETRRKIAENQPDMSGENNPNYGNPRNWKPSEKQVEAIIKANKGIPKSQEHKQKISESNKGKKRKMETRIRGSKWQNTTGYFRVSKIKCESCDDGFSWAYDYDEVNNKRKRLKSVDINKLEKKVKSFGLEWFIIDQEKAENTKRINEELNEKRILRRSQKKPYKPSRNNKYDLWDHSKVTYQKKVFRACKGKEPRKCFTLYYEGRQIFIGTFIDFLSPIIINDLITEFKK